MKIILFTLAIFLLVSASKQQDELSQAKKIQTVRKSQELAERKL